MKGNWIRKITAMLLCAVLGVTSLPLSTFAQEEYADGLLAGDAGTDARWEVVQDESEEISDSGTAQTLQSGQGQVQEPEKIQTPGEQESAQNKNVEPPQADSVDETWTATDNTGRTESIDWTNHTDDFLLTILKLSYIQGDQEIEINAEGNRIDAGDIALPGDGKVTLAMQYQFLRDANGAGEKVQAGDTFSFALDQGLLTVEDTVDPVDVVNEAGLKTASYTIAQGKVVVTFADLADISDHSAKFEIEAVVNKDALKEETSEYAITLQQPESADAVRALVVLPKKERPEADAEDVPADPGDSQGLGQAGEDIKVVRNKLAGNLQSRTDPNKRPEGDAAWDCTNANEQIKLEPGKMFFKNKETGRYEAVQKGADGKYNFGDDFYKIAGIKFSMDFAILKDGALREIQPGDYFHFQLPSQYFQLKEHAAEDIIFSGIKIGEFIVSKAGDNYDVKVVFSDALSKDNGYTNIQGGLTLTADLRETGFVGDGTGVDVPLEYAGQTVTLHFPNSSSSIEGIEKTGKYITETNQMQWEITVGSLTPGVSLSGVQVTDILPFAQEPGFHFKGETETIGTFDEGSKTFQYTFTEEDERKAPQTIVVTSTVPDNMIPGQTQGMISNTATMSDAPDAVIKRVGEPESSTSQNTFDAPGVTKEGKPINSDIIRWTLTVNGQNPAYKIWNPVIYDGLPHNLKLAEGSEYGNITILDHETGQTLKTLTPGEASEIPDSPNPSNIVTTDSSAAYTLTDEADQTDSKYKLTRLAVSLGSDVANPVTKAYDIVFYTTIIDKNESIQADNQLKYNNKATMKGWVGGNGTGPGGKWTEFNMDIDTVFNSAHIEKTTPSYDEKTGQITWEIHPSTRLDAYTEVVITDTITWPEDVLEDTGIRHDGKHTLVADSVEVYNQTSKLTAGADYTLAVNSDNKTFSVTLSGSRGYALKNIKILCRTQADNFNQENLDDKMYHNQVALDVTDAANTHYLAQDDAQREFQNQILTKSPQGFETNESGDTYLHYLIVVNGNNMDLTGSAASLTDDLAAMVTAGSDPAAQWKLDQSRTKIQWDKGDGTLEEKRDDCSDNSTASKLDIEWSNGFQGKRVIDIYLKLDNKESVLNKDVTLSVKNTAEFQTPKLNNGGKITYTTSGTEDLAKLENQLITKKNGGLKVPPSGSGEPSYIDWNVKINPNHVKLLRQNGGDITTLTVEDTMPAGVRLDYSSVKLTDDKGNALQGFDKNADVSIIANDNGTSAMRVTLPKNNGTSQYDIGYVLAYRTQIVASSDTGFVTNHVVLNTDGEKKSGQDSEAEVADGAWGSLTAVRGFQFYKYDADLGGTKRPLSNVAFGLYEKQDVPGSDPSYTLVDKVVTRVDGSALFLNLSPDKQYAYKEETALPGYAQDTRYHDIDIQGSGIQTGAPVKNSRIRHRFSITKKGLKGEGDYTASENLAGVEFTLFANYTGENLDQINAYTQVMNPTTPPGAQVPGSFVSGADGKVDFGELPWGNYYVCEAKAAAGYHLNGDGSTVKLANSYWFQVKYSESAPYDANAMTVAPYAGPAGSGAWNTEPADFTNGEILNYENHVSFVKFKETDIGKELLADADFALYQLPNDATAIKTWNTNDADIQPDKVKTFYGLLPGEYRVKEVSRSSDLESNHAMLSIDFKVDAYGKVTRTDNGDEACAKVNTVYAEAKRKVTNAVEIINKYTGLTVEKVDQFGGGVPGAAFGIYQDKDGTTPAAGVSPGSFTTSADAYKAAFKKLSCKTIYWLVESSVPEGYFGADPVCFMITDYNELKFLDPDHPDIDSPLTEAQVKGSYKDIVEVPGNSPAVKLRNVQKLAPVGLVKQDDNNHAMGNVQFELYKTGANPDGSDQLVSVLGRDGTPAALTTDGGGVLKTGKQGAAVLNADNDYKPLNQGLKPGVYYFRELDTASKYPGFHYDSAACKSEDIAVAIEDAAGAKEKVAEYTKNPGNNEVVWNSNDSAKDTPVTVVANTSLNAYLLFDKADAADNGGKLGGAVFELYKTGVAGKIATITTASENTTGTVTGASGKTYHIPVAKGQGFYGEKLSKGAYRLKEITPPKGYKLGSAPEWEFTVSETDYNEIDQSEPSSTAGWKPVRVKAAESSLGENVFVNEKNAVSFRKTDQTDVTENKAIAGAVFKLTSESGEAGFANLDSLDESFTYEREKHCITWTSSAVADARLAGHLIAGVSYTLAETEAPDGYKLPDEPAAKVTFRVKADGTLEQVSGPCSYEANSVSLYVQDEKTTFAVTKVDSNNNPVYGSEFVISEDDKGARAVKNAAGDELRWTTSEVDSNTKRWEGLKAGTYYLVETKTAPGLQTAKPIQFELTDKNEIRLKNQQGEVLKAEGDDYYTITMTDMVTMGHVTLTKTDNNAAAKKPLSGVMLELWKSADADGRIADEAKDLKLFGDIVTDGSGQWTTRDRTETNPDSGKAFGAGLKEGWYYFKETKTLDGYALDAAPQWFQIKNEDHYETHNKNVEISIVNAPVNAAVRFRKVDEVDAGGIPGTTFTLYQIPEGSAGEESWVKIQEVVTGRKGDVISWRDIASTDHVYTLMEDGEGYIALRGKGAYALKETQAAEGYVLDPAKPFTAIFTVGNTETFKDRILDLSGDLSQEVIDQYQLTVKHASYKENNIANARKTGMVTLEKVDGANEEKLNKVGFTLYKAKEADSAAEKIREFFTGKSYEKKEAAVWEEAVCNDGTLAISGLEWGDYYIEETSALEGYVPDHTRHPFKIDGHNTEVKLAVDLGQIKNAQTEIRFYKFGSYNESCSNPELTGAPDPNALAPMPGVEFTAYDKNHAGKSYTAVSELTDITDENGQALGQTACVTFRNLPIGTYSIRETKTLPGYKLDETDYTAVIDENGQFHGLTYEDGSGVAGNMLINDVHRASITFTKVDEKDKSKVLPGSTYGLYKKASDISDLEENPLPQAVRAAYGRYGRAVFSRMAAEGLKAAQTPEANKLVLIATAVTDEQGVLTFDGVRMNTEYVIRELAAPDGHYVSANPISMRFEVDGEGTITSTLLNNGGGTATVDPVTGEIVWLEPVTEVAFAKKDEKGNLLGGASLQVVDADGNIVKTWTSSGSEAYVIRGLLTIGREYTLVETKAPTGYQIAEPVTFTVDDTPVGPNQNKVQTVEMVDKAAPGLTPGSAPGADSGALSGDLLKLSGVRTGDASHIALYIVLLAIAAAAALFVKKKKRQWDK